MTPSPIPLPALHRSLVTSEFTQRAAGAIIGSAAGDALGAPYEFGPAGQYSARFPSPVLGGTGEMTGGGTWRPAEFTDDTQMAILQAESLLECSGLDEADLFGRFRAWAVDAKDVGTQTRAVLGSDLLGSAAASRFYERTGRAAGNGAVMRATPTAVLLATATEADTIAFARATAAITHGDPAAGWGTAAFHVMVRAALRGDDPWSALTRFLAALPDDQSLWRTMLSPDWDPSDTRDRSNFSVWGCLAQAVWAVRRSNTFTHAVTTAIDLGGDTDTVAAVTGGLAGAVHGIAAVPSRWTTYLNGDIGTPHGVRHLTVDDLRDLTARVLGNAHRGPNVFDALGPAEIVPGLYAANLGGAIRTPDEWAVISLCLVGDTLASHPVRREVHLIDQDPDHDGDHNLGLVDAVDDAVTSIDAFLAEGRTVVVHCYGGASRTGLVLRAWLMRARGLTDAEAIDHITARWPHLGLWSESFTAHLSQR